MTAFFLYAADHRAKVREELGEGCTVGDISKKIGKQWAEIDDDEKQKYQDQAAKNKAQYEKNKEVILEKQRTNYEPEKRQEKHRENYEPEKRR